MGKHNDLGRNGEILAVQFLKDKGHFILQTNYRSTHKEIDIISLEKDVLVFSEIKTRSSFRMGFPEEAVTRRKQNLLKAAATDFLESHPGYQKIRFDVISILTKNKRIGEIRHFEDAFY